MPQPRHADSPTDGYNTLGGTADQSGSRLGPCQHFPSPPIDPLVETKFDIAYCPLGATMLGGAERSILDLATRFALRGNRVLMMVGSDLLATGLTEDARKRGIVVKSFDWSRSLGFLENAKAALKATRAVNAHIVHFNMSWLPWMWLVPLAFRWQTSSKLIGTMRAMPDPHALVPRRKHLGFLPGLQLWHWPEVIVGWFWGRLLHRTITINAKDFPMRLTRDYWYPAKRISVIYNGIEARHIPQEGKARRALRAKAATSERDCLICFAGRLSPEKGVDLLLEALHSLPPRFRLVIVGEGPHRSALEARAADLKLDERVFFAGFSDRAAEWMAASDVVAVPSTWYEAFGRVVVEALNEGTPVVASRIGGMAELFEDGVHGIFVSAGSIAELRDAISSLESAPEMRARMGTAGRALVAEKYSLDRVEDEYRREYQALSGLELR